MFLEQQHYSKHYSITMTGEGDSLTYGALISKPFV